MPHHLFHRALEDNEANVAWWDNFSKMYRIKIADMRRTNLADCLWTGVAVRKYMGDAKVSMACITDGHFHVDAMPPYPLARIGNLLSTMEELCADGGDMKNLFETSKLVKWGVNRIPIVPMTANMPPKAKDSLAKGPLRLNHFIPKGLLRLNIGSNEGLARIIKIHQEDSGIGGATAPKIYKAVVADLNIFDRVIKVLVYIIDKQLIFNGS